MLELFGCLLITLMGVSLLVAIYLVKCINDCIDTISLRKIQIVPIPMTIKIDGI